MLKKSDFEFAVAQVFKIEINEVIIITDLEELIGADPKKKIIYETFKIDTLGDFCLRVDFTIRDNRIIPTSDTEIYSKFTNLLNCKLMVDSSSDIPNEMLIIEGISSFADSSFDAAEAICLE